MDKENDKPAETSSQHKPAGALSFRRLVWILVLLIVGFMVFKGASTVLDNIRRQICGNHLTSGAIALANYADIYGSLPSHTRMNEDGEPVLSWRFETAVILCYYVDFDEKCFLSRPWNDPANDFLNTFDGFQCPSRHKKSRTTTDYVAVTGPETMWPDEGTREWPAEDAHQPTLIVEWPESDIHWAEPRDVTIDEFLDWFRKPVKERSKTHPRSILCIDTAMNVHELPLDSDPEEVRRMLMVEPTER